MSYWGLTQRIIGGTSNLIGEPSNIMIRSERRMKRDIHEYSMVSRAHG